MTEIHINVGSVLGISAKYLISLSINGDQFGGSFSAVFNSDFASQIAEKTPVTVFSNLVGIVDSSTVSQGVSGRVVRIDGRLALPNMLSTKAKVFQSRLPWLCEGKPVPYLNDLSAFESDPSYELIDDMRAMDVIRKIGNMHSVPVQGSLAINYRMFTYRLEANRSVMEVMQEIALAGASNAIYENGQVRILPWSATNEGSGISEGLNHVENDFEYTSVKSEFDSVIIEGSSTMTPYNSFYGGMPEKIASVSFSAGSVSLKDLTIGSGVNQASEEWVFPVDETTDDPNDAFNSSGTNLWAKVDFLNEIDRVTRKSLSNTLLTNSRVDSAWTYVAYSSGQVDYAKFLETYKSFEDRLNQNIGGAVSDAIVNENSFLALLRWSKAFTTVVVSDDIHPRVYVEPSSDAPEKLGPNQFGQVPHTNEIALQGADGIPTSFSGSPLADYFLLPMELRVAPPGIGFNVSLDLDRSFPLSVVFTEERSSKVYPANSAISHTLRITDAYRTEQFGTVELKKGFNVFEVESSSFEPDEDAEINTLADHLRAVQERTASFYLVPKAVGEVIPVKGGTVVPTGNISSYASSVYEDIDFEDELMANALAIKQITPVYDSEQVPDPNKALIITHSSSKIDYSGVYSFCLPFVNQLGVSKMRVSTDGTYLPFTDSGLVQENTDPISGSWSLYGLKRIMTPATVVRGPSGSHVNYSGINAERDASFKGTVDGLANPKTIKSDLVTDFMGSNSHLQSLANELYSIINKPFIAYSPTFIAADLALPKIGGSINVGGKSSQVVSWSVRIDHKGFRKTLNCGRLPTL